MIRLIGIASVVLAVALTQSAIADQALAQASGCTACHQVETKVVGPSYKDVAARYKADAGAKAMLIAKVRTGGSGNWGDVPMPPNVTINDADLDVVMSWILSN